MLDEDGLTLDFIAGISEHAIVAVNKSEQILFYNHQASCVFPQITQRKALSEILPQKNFIPLSYNISIAFYHTKPLSFYWRHNGRFYHITTHINKDMLFLCLRDITEIRNQANSLQNTQYRFDLLEKFLEAGYWELDINNKRFYWSKGMYQLFDLSADKKYCFQNLIRHFIHPDDIVIYKEKLRELFRCSNIVFGQIRIISSTKQIKLCNFKATTNFINGEKIFCGIFQEISSKPVQYDNFALTKIVHDIKQQVQTIKLFTSKIQENADSLINKYSANIIQQCNNITENINNVAYFSKFNYIKKQTFDLGGFLQSVCQEYQDIAHINKIKILCRLSSVMINSDKFLFSQIIRNLLNNALHHTKNKIIIGNDNNSVWIADNGKGINNQENGKIFDLFKHGDTNTYFQGWGIGLYIAKQNAEHLGYHLSFKTKEDHYTIFRLKFS